MEVIRLCTELDKFHSTCRQACKYSRRLNSALWQAKIDPTIKNSLIWYHPKPE